MKCTHYATDRFSIGFLCSAKEVGQSGFPITGSECEGGRCADLSDWAG